MNEFENDFAIAKCIRMRNVQSNSKESDGCIGTKIALDEKWNTEKKHVTRGPLFTMISKSAAMAIKRALSNWRRNVYLINDHKLKFN